MCSRFSYNTSLAGQTILNGDLVLSPGESVVVQSWTDLDDTAADLAIYVDGTFSSPDSMVDFVKR